jgi:chromosome segregation ATPase
MGGMADHVLDDLYGAKPEEFTALRSELATAAKKRGDADAARRISAARKPTTAAWIVNLLALRNADAKRRLADLGDQLREAHAAMDGERIRELSSGQRRLVDELTRTGFAEADVADPSAALRDDVTSTLQAAIADPDVAARLGRLTKAERWSGFGELGDTSMVFTAARGKAKKEPAQQKPVQQEQRDDKDDVARRQREQARAAVAAAERVKVDADAAMAELQSDLATARLRHDDARRRLQDAERGLAAAEDAYDKAKQASRDAAAAMKEAKAQLKSAGR